MQHNHEISNLILTFRRLLNSVKSWRDIIAISASSFPFCYCKRTPQRHDAILIIYVGCSYRLFILISIIIRAAEECGWLEIHLVHSACVLVCVWNRYVKCVGRYVCVVWVCVCAFVVQFSTHTVENWMPHCLFELESALFFVYFFLWFLFFIRSFYFVM